jgi:hypothetical protein
MTMGVGVDFIPTTQGVVPVFANQISQGAGFIGVSDFSENIGSGAFQMIPAAMTFSNYQVCGLGATTGTQQRIAVLQSGASPGTVPSTAQLTATATSSTGACPGAVSGTYLTGAGATGNYAATAGSTISTAYTIANAPTATPIKISAAVVVGGGSASLFTPLHTYYMSPGASPPAGWSAGNDSNNGLTISTPWASPNHAVVCGDVIIAGAGTYNGDMGTFGVVSGCPSTSGGLASSPGGIYAAVLTCGGADVTACKVTCATGACNGNPGFGPPQVAIDVRQSNWSVQGWNLTCAEPGSGTVNECEAMEAVGKEVGGSGCQATTQFISFINNYTYNNGQAFDTQSCLGANGPDYVAVVGNITQNSAQINFTDNGICIGAIDIISPGKSDADTTHTHFYVYGNYSYNNVVPKCDAEFDGEDYLIDVIDNNDVVGHVVEANNVGFYAERNCFNITWDGNAAAPLLKFYGNTCTLDNQRDSANPGGDNSEWLNVSSSFNFSIYNNIFQAVYATNPQTGSEVLFGLLSEGSTGAFLVGNQVRTGAENAVYGCVTGTLTSPCLNGVGNSGAAASGPSTSGTNTFVNVAFKSLTDLTTNHLGVPTCTGFVTTTGCMGWNANTSTLTSVSILDDLSQTGATGKGFQLPSITCDGTGGDDLNTDYPYWLKGIVYLHWNGSTSAPAFTENSDLVTRPCGS